MEKFLDSTFKIVLILTGVIVSLANLPAAWLTYEMGLAVHEIEQAAEAHREAKEAYWKDEFDRQMRNYAHPDHNKYQGR